MARARSRNLTLEQSYEAAYLWLFHIDQAPTEVVENPPEQVELYSEELICWVRATREVPQKAILAMLNVADERKKVIFSAAGFSPGAVSISESQGIALFAIGRDGSVRAETGHAIVMMPASAPPPPFAAPPDPDEMGTLAANWGTTHFDSDVWVDCPECGTNQHVSLDACRVCGTRLVREQLSPVSGPQYKCRDCGSHDIEVLHPGMPSSAEPEESRH
jgi:predicted RNA-binding Zn-ribbon protein involved in translation (DUF1610 family)